METILLLRIDSTKPVGACPFLSVTLIAIQTQSPPPLSLSLFLCTIQNLSPFLHSFFPWMHCSFVEIQQIQLSFFSHFPYCPSLLVFDMKFLFSSPASPDANMCSSRSASSGCLAGVLRRLLCSGSLPTYPSDHIRDSSSPVFGKDENLKGGEKMEVVTAPGIVARLMGLDTMPDINLVSSPIKGNSIVRSRSMNSMDFWPESEATEEGRHRRVKSSLSFRESPVFFETENEDYLLLSFGDEGELSELRRKERKWEMGPGELRQRNTERSGNKRSTRQHVSEKKKKKKKDKEDDNPRKNVPTGKENVSDQPSQMVSNKREVIDFPEKKKKNCSETQKVEPECTSENSSPVSVLDFSEFIDDPELPTSEEDLKSNGSSSRRTLSPELENYEHPCPESSSNPIREDGEAKKNEGKCTESRKTAFHGLKYSGLWDEICRLVGGEMMETTWLYKEIKKHDEFEDLGADFGSQILDELLQELVHHLCELPTKNFEL